MNLPLFIARRIYGETGDNRKVSRPVVRIATLGVALGLAVMIITISVVIGFKHTIRDKVVGFGSHVQVVNYLSMQSVDPYPVCIGDSMMNVLKSVDGVKHVGRFALTQGILKTNDDFLGINFKGVAQDYDYTFLNNSMIEGEIPSFTDSVASSKVLLSRMVADKLMLKTGDKVYAYFINKDVRARRFTVCGIYETNMAQFDDLVCFTDLYTVVKLNRWEDEQCTGAELLVDDFSRIDDIARNVNTAVGRDADRFGQSYTPQTIYNAYPQVFSWLDLLDINVWIILALMVCVAGFTMISGLLIIILERTQMIGVLKSLGADNTTIRHTFMWLSAFIIGKGLLIGNVLGIGLVVLQSTTGFVTLDPATYYVSTAPVELDVPLIILLNVATLFICLLVLIAPSFLISHIHPAKSMHYE